MTHRKPKPDAFPVTSKIGGKGGGDVSDLLPLPAKNLEALANRFRKVFYVPGNRDIWVIRDGKGKTSFDKFKQIAAVMRNCGKSGTAFHDASNSILPLLVCNEGGHTNNNAAQFFEVMRKRQVFEK